MASVVTKQGALTAGYNFAITAWWSLDVLLVWLGAGGAIVRWQRLALSVALFVSLIVAAVILKDGVVRWLGVALAVSVAATAFGRLSSGRSPRPEGV